MCCVKNVSVLTTVQIVQLILFTIKIKKSFYVITVDILRVCKENVKKITFVILFSVDQG